MHSRISRKEESSEIIPDRSMTRVITYGTYDLLHEGHIRLLKRAKALGDYLIVGVTGDGFDLNRGKINVKQSLMERIEAVKATGLADMIIVEEYEGQKIDDIKRYEADIFTVGSDWKGKFDYLNELCKVVYLDRTDGISSSDIRSEKSEVRIGLVGESPILNKFYRESTFVNGAVISGICCKDTSLLSEAIKSLPFVTESLDLLLPQCDAVYIITRPENHFKDIKVALEAGKHVLSESPVTLNAKEYDYLLNIAADKGLVLMDGIKTAYSMAFNRMVLMVKGGAIGDVVSVDATCTSLRNQMLSDGKENSYFWNSMSFWASTAMLPVFDLLGTEFTRKEIVSKVPDEDSRFDLFSRISFIYPHGVATIRIGQGVKSEGDLVISGTKGYVYVPAPWWKTDYFEIRYENSSDNRRFFYQLEGEGIRFEILSFLRQIEQGTKFSYVSHEVTKKMISVISDFYSGNYIPI